MFIEHSKVESVEKISDRIFLLKAHSPSIAGSIKPGQFCNIKVSESDFPLLRRPFSICDVEGDSVFFMIDIIGEGTKILSEKKTGDALDILGPLGIGFNDEGDYEYAVIVAGGIGAAPFPFLYKSLASRKIITLLGARTSSLLIKERMRNIAIATDDGSEGFHGNAVSLLKEKIKEIGNSSFRIFACGPNVMLRALQSYTNENNYDCQISVESAMACGFGICQGCPIETTEDGSYKLICKDGPVFNAKDVKL